MYDLTPVLDAQIRAARAEVPTKLFDMFYKERYFSICTLRDCMRTMGDSVKHDDPRLEQLNTFHCVEWSAFNKEHRKMIQANCLELCGLSNSIGALMYEAPYRPSAMRKAWNWFWNYLLG